MEGRNKGRSEDRKRRRKEFGRNINSEQMIIHRNHLSITLAANVLITKFLINDSLKSHKKSLTSIL
jgi:hypothetical protein